MSYFNATKVECSKERLKEIFWQASCPECGGDLTLYEGAILYCKKCNRSYYNQEVIDASKNPQRGYSKGYTKELKISTK